jgi:hypothetical protein
MNLFSIDLTTQEISTIRQSLDVVSISGKDAKFLANLQNKLDSEIANIQQTIKQAEAQKQLELQQALLAEAKKVAKASAI